NPLLQESRDAWYSPLSYRMLPPRLRACAERTFIDGIASPSRRSAASDWEWALACTLEQIAHCRSCNQDSPFPYWQPAGSEGRRCHFCHARFDPPAAVLKLFRSREGLPSEFRSAGRTIVLTREFPFLPSEALGDVPGPAGTGYEPHSAPLGQLADGSGPLRLNNLSANTWRVYPRGGGHWTDVPPNGSAELAPGSTIQLDHATLALAAEA
ncbi:MAG TPA: hypothetical protein VKT77_10180, partial [Chthonomonadaceae bacterium]|nr:hypothetical protein [Chthonomonadaceae bacterium]